jgi:hypothetical protein
MCGLSGRRMIGEETGKMSVLTIRMPDGKA